MSVYLDCNATAPIEPDVGAAMHHFLVEEYGNAGSRTHQFGSRAKRAVQEARSQVAGLVSASPEEVLFTSGATESNNLALLGLSAYGEETGRKHIVTSAIEHKAVLEPSEELGRRGFDVSVVPVDSGGRVSADDVFSAMRPETLVVSIMHVNNETGVVQPVEDIAEKLRDHTAFLHVDAAQGFGKRIPELKSPRIDLISVSAHKLYGPKGIGALIARRRGYQRLPLKPIHFGGGQERGLRPGTLPVPQIVGLGVAAGLAARAHELRRASNLRFREECIKALTPLGIEQNGAPDFTIEHTLNFSIPGVDGEAAILALKNHIAVSNGSACTSQQYEPSHVLRAMGLSDDRIAGAIRMSWCHMTERPNWEEVASVLRELVA